MYIHGELQIESHVFLVLKYVDFHTLAPIHNLQWQPALVAPNVHNCNTIGNTILVRGGGIRFLFLGQLQFLINKLHGRLGSRDLLFLSYVCHFESSSSTASVYLLKIRSHIHTHSYCWTVKMRTHISRWKFEGDVRIHQFYHLSNIWNPSILCCRPGNSVWQQFLQLHLAMIASWSMALMSFGGGFVLGCVWRTWSCSNPRDF